MWVKICANTCAEDALKAAELGADAVGFVFAPSVRQVTATQVRAISEVLPEGVERVGVFGAANAEEIAKTAHAAKLTAVQLHGGFDRSLSERLGELLARNISVIQTIHWTVGANPDGEVRGTADQLATIAGYGLGRRVLIDARVGGKSGGTGIAFDWSSGAGVLSSQPGLRIIVAGGLRVENVAEAVRVLKPWGVDVASGVERDPGRKDSGKMAQFIVNARLV